MVMSPAEPKPIGLHCQFVCAQTGNLTEHTHIVPVCLVGHIAHYRTGASKPEVSVSWNQVPHHGMYLGGVGSVATTAVAGAGARTDRLASEESPCTHMHADRIGMISTQNKPNHNRHRDSICAANLLVCLSPLSVPYRSVALSLRQRLSVYCAQHRMIITPHFAD